MPMPALVWNAPNVITLVRIALSPVVLALLMFDGSTGGSLRWLAAGVFVLIIATDGIDGALARRNNQVTEFGKLLDPIADKALIGCALVGLSLIGELSWWVVALILVREIGMTLYRMFVLSHGVIAASFLGKAKTFMQAIAVSVALFPFSHMWGSRMDIVNIALMSAAVLLTLLSAVEYIFQDLGQRKVNHVV